MRKQAIVVAGLLITGLAAAPAAAWMHAGRWGHAEGGGGSWSAQGWRGGSASGGGGSWSGTGWRGGTASGGGGSWHGTGAYGGTASGGGGYWHATGAYGTTAYGGYNRYYGGTYATYHPPTVVNTYYGNGCYGCGGWGAAGAAAVGLGAGAALGAASANAYAAGVASGSALGTGAIYTTLPLGCIYRPVLALYQCDGSWLSASYGANGVYYRAVPAP
jgi:hypothetical protein